jgi:hypothetical protein
MLCNLCLIRVELFNLHMVSVSKLPLFLSLPVCRRTGEGAGGKGVGVEPNHGPQECVALYNSFHTRWLLLNNPSKLHHFTMWNLLYLERTNLTASQRTARKPGPLYVVQYSLAGSGLCALPEGGAAGGAVGGRFDGSVAGVWGVLPVWRAGAARVITETNSLHETGQIN